MWSDNEKSPQSPEDATAAWLAAFSREGVPVGTPSPPLPRAPIALYDELDASDAKRSTGAAGDPLGNTAKSVSHFPSATDAQERRATRFKHQRAAAKLLPNSRTGLCMWAVASLSYGVDVINNTQEGRARFSGLQTCGSVWACPCCSGTVSGNVAAS